jgi:5-methylcytosine-specific restriction enzyme A
MGKRTRRTTVQKGYDAAWRKLRNAFLSFHPMCECPDCKRNGDIVEATVVDHIVPISQRPELRLVWSNLRAMSKQHHDRHTARMNAGSR